MFQKKMFLSCFLFYVFPIEKNIRFFANPLLYAFVLVFRSLSSCSWGFLTRTLLNRKTFNLLALPLQNRRCKHCLCPAWIFAPSAYVQICSSPNPISQPSIKTSPFPESIFANPFNRRRDSQKHFLISVSSAIVRDKGQTCLHCRPNRRRGPEVEQPLKDWA